MAYKAHILLSRLSGRTGPPSCPAFGSRVKVGRDSPVLFPRRKQLMKIDASRKDVLCSWIERLDVMRPEEGEKNAK